MNIDSTLLTLKINPLPEDDEEHLEQLSIQLSDELNELNIERVEVVDSGKAPEGTKDIPDVPVWGKLLIDVLPGAIPSVVNAVQSWLRQDEGRSVTLEIGGDKLQVTGISSEQQRELTNAWLNRHRARMGRDV